MAGVTFARKVNKLCGFQAAGAFVSVEIFRHAVHISECRLALRSLSMRLGQTHGCHLQYLFARCVSAAGIMQIRAE
jgi:hypothetical protein